MSSSLNIVVVSPDRGVRAEIESACMALDGPRPVIHPADSARQGVEAARNRAPELLLVEVTADARSLAAFTREVADCSPHTVVAAVFRSQAAEAELSESDFLIAAIRAGVRDFLRRPVSTAELSALLARVDRSVSRVPVVNGRIVSFISNKGGVGKSTLAANTACGLAARNPGRVLLVDASLQMGVCASMLDLQPSATIADAVQEIERLDETLLRQMAAPHDCGLHLLAAPASALEAARIDDQAMARILTLARRTYDHVIVDTFPMFDRVVIAVLDLSDRAYIVLESVVPTLLGGVKLIELLDGLGYAREKQRVVLNRFTRLPGNLQPHEVAERLRREVNLVVPFDKQIVVAANTGQPHILRAGRFFGSGPRLRQLVDEIHAMELSEPADVETRFAGNSRRV